MATQRFSKALLKYLFWERDWLRGGRPDEITDLLEDYWYELPSEDIDYCNLRGILQEDSETWIGGNGYSHGMLDQLEDQIKIK
jgi:hypothetical protein